MSFAKNSQNRVLVCVPVYNAEDCLSDTLKSILNQTFKKFEIFVVDNCSNDNTSEVAEHFKNNFDEDNKIHIIKNKKNLGRIGNWNNCLDLFRQSDFNYLKFVFAGDTLRNNCLEKLTDVFASNSGIGLAASGYYVHSLKNKADKKVSFSKDMSFNPVEGLKAFITNSNWVGAPLACMFSKKAIEEIKFSDGIDWASDWKFYVDVTKNNNSFYINDALADFYVSKRKYYADNIASAAASAEELFVKYYTLQKLEELDSELVRKFRNNLYIAEGKHLFKNLSLIDIIWLTIYKFAKNIKNIWHG